MRFYWILKAQKEYLLRSILGIIFLAQFANAQSSSTSLEEFGVPKLSLPSSSSKRASVFGHFRFESLQYMTALDDAPSLTTSQFLSGHITAATYKRDPFSVNWAADLSAGTFFSLKQSYYSIQEIYMAMPLSDHSNVSLGRKKYDWTEIDKIWSLGLWQPRYAIDALRPEDQGLTGLFFDYNKEYFQFLGFASTIFIPTMGPDVREEDGAIKADNRWYRPPSRQSGKISISYKLNIGDQMKLAEQDSYGARARFGHTERGPWMALAAGRKPVNDLVLQRCLHCVDYLSNANFVVSPHVVHHKVFSTDIGYQFEDVKASISYYEDMPEELLPPPDYAIQKFFPVKIYGANIDWSVKEFLSRPLQVQLGYIKVYGDVIQDIESNGQPSDITMFTYRYRFSNAATARVVGPLTSVYGRPLITKFGYTYDFDQAGSILSTEFQYQWNRTWSYLLGIDMLGSDDANSTSDGFINTYRANDRAYAGVSYVF